MRTYFDGLIGRIASQGVDIELGEGVDFRAPFSASLNTLSNMVEIDVDVAGIETPVYSAGAGLTSTPDGTDFVLSVNTASESVFGGITAAIYSALAGWFGTLYTPANVAVPSDSTWYSLATFPESRLPANSARKFGVEIVSFAAAESTHLLETIGPYVISEYSSQYRILSPDGSDSGLSSTPSAVTDLDTMQLRLSKASGGAWSVDVNNSSGTALTARARLFFGQTETFA